MDEINAPERLLFQDTEVGVNTVRNTYFLTNVQFCVMLDIGMR